ncbi:MAG: hypothetical protein NVS1B2_03210 [Vulcanimicrobiaceae bacterium]
MRTFDRIDDARVAARRDDDEPAVLYVEARRVFVVMEVRHDATLLFRGGKVVGRAAGAVAYADLGNGRVASDCVA